MDMAVIFTNDTESLQQVNLCRLYKKVIYPFELVGFSIRKRKTAFDNNMEQIQFL